MRSSALRQPAWDPTTIARVDAYREADGHILEGAIWTAEGRWQPIVDGVPCFLDGELRPDFSEFAARHNLSGEPARPKPADSEHRRTVDTFSDKWRRFQDYGMGAGHQAFLLDWYTQKLGVPDVAALKAFYRGKSRVLEVGPGSGFNTRFMAEHVRGEVFAADISDAAHTTFRNTRDLPNCHVIQADLMRLPFADGSFDFVIADGVLHHTPDTRKAVEALWRKVAPGGEFFFYVYRKMGAARQFCDRHINAAFSKLDPEACYEACRGLTELGRELSRLNVRVRLETGVPILGIPPGEHNVQRLLYYNFVKCFWNEAFDFETNNMVNYDWYHPVFAWQHTEEEVAGWMDALSCADYRFHPANPNGICVVLRKPAAARAAA